MSYTIYKSIKQNKDGTFDCVCAVNNIVPLWWENYHMDYYNREMEGFSNEYKKLAFLIQSIYCGDKFYQKRWKDEQKIVSKVISKQGSDFYEKFYKAFQDKKSPVLFELLYYFKMDFDSELKKRGEVKNYYVKIGDKYVAKLTKKKAMMAFDVDYAKVFKDSIENLRERFSGYMTYGLEIEEV